MLATIRRARLIILSLSIIALSFGLIYSGSRWINASAQKTAMRVATPSTPFNQQLKQPARQLADQAAMWQRNGREQSEQSFDLLRRLPEGKSEITDANYEAQRVRLCQMARLNHKAGDGFSWRPLGPDVRVAGGDPCQSSQAVSLKSPLSQPSGLNASDSKSARFYRGAVAPDGRTLLGGTFNRGLLRGSGDGNWQTLADGAWGFAAFNSDSPEMIYAAQAGQPLSAALKKSLDGGRTFVDSVSGLADTGLFIPTFAISPDNGLQLWAGGRSLWQTMDGAESWHQASAPIPGSDQSLVSALAVAPGNSNLVLTGTSEGFLLRTEQALAADAQTVWGYSKPRDGFVSSIVFDPANANIAYATYSTFGGAHIWRSTDAGMSWMAVDEVSDSTADVGLPDVPFHSLAVDPNNSSHLFAGSDLGLFTSDNGGQSWTWLRGGFGVDVVEALVMNRTGDETKLYVFTRASGAWAVVISAPEQSCSYTRTLSESVFRSAATTGSVTVTAQGTNCNWAARSDADWLTITSGTLGAGNGKVEFSVAANTTGATRTGKLIVAGAEVVVYQLGAGGSCAAQAIIAGQIISGALSANDCPSTIRPYSGLYLSDRYKFEGKQNTRVSIVNITSGYPPYLYLVGPSGQIVTQAGSYFDSRNTARIPSSGDFFTLPATGTYTIEATTDFSGYQGNYTLSLTQVPENCANYALFATNAKFEAEGGEASVQVSAPGGCPWTAKTAVDWVRFTSGEIGGGANFVTFRVAPNTGADARTTRLEIAGQGLTIEQAGRGGACLPQPIKFNEPVRSGVSNADCLAGSGSLRSERFVFSAMAGQPIAINVTNLSTSSGTNMILRDPNGQTLTQGSGKIPGGDGLLTLPDTGNYTLEVFLPDFLLTVFAPTPGCTFAVSPTTPQRFESNSVSGAASIGSVNITTVANCEWFASSENDWITFGAAGQPGTLTTKGKGPGKLEFRVAANSFGLSRSGSILVNGQRLAIDQAGNGGSCSVAPIKPGQTVQGTVNDADCRRRYVDNSTGGAGTTADFYTFTGKAGDQINLSVSTTGFLPYLTLVTAAGTRVDSAYYELPSAGGYIKLPVDGDYIIELSGGGGSSSSNTYFLTMTNTPAGCNFSLAPGKERFNAQGGTGIVNVLATSGCDWTVLSYSGSSVTVDAGATGKGNGTVAYTVGPNLTFKERTLTLKIAGQYFYIQQAGSDGACLPMSLTASVPVNERISSGDCLETFSTNSFGGTVTYPADRYTFAGAAGEQIAISAVVQPPTVLTNGLRLQLYGPDNVLISDLFRRIPATGSFVVPVTGMYKLIVTANVNFGTAGGQIPYALSLTKIPTGCSYEAIANAQRFEAAGGSSSVNITAGGNCPWVARSSATWLTLTQTTGVGGAKVDFSLAENTTTQSRTARITINDERDIVIEQAGKGGVCAPLDTAEGQTVIGTLGNGDCTLPGNSGVGRRYRFDGVAGDQVALYFDKTIYSTQLRFPGNGGPSISYRAQRVPDTGYITLPVTGTYFVDLAGPGDYVMTIEAVKPGCGFTLLAQPKTYPAAGGAGTIQVLTGAECKWTARAIDAFATINTTTPPANAGSVTGNGTVAFTLAPNASATARTATFFIGGQRVTIEQGGTGGGCAATPIIIGQTINGAISTADCVSIYPNQAGSYYGPPRADRYSLDFTAGQQFAIQAGSTAFTAEILVINPSGVVIARANERWPSNTDFATLPSSGTHIIEVRPSGSSYDRTGAYAIRLIAPTACVVSLTPVDQTFENSGGQGNASIVTGTGCAWTATSQQSWITIKDSTPASGIGNAKLEYTVAANPSNNLRTGSIKVGTQTLTVRQAGLQGSCAIKPLTLNQTVTGTLTHGDCPMRYSGLNYSQSYADFYSFAGTAGDVVTWDATVFSVTIVAPNGLVMPNQLSSSSFGPVAGKVVLPDNGTYLVEFGYGAIRDYEFKLQSSPGNCAYIVTPQTPDAIDVGGGSVSVNVVAGANCPWTAAIQTPSSGSPVTWLRTVAGASGAGSGKVTLTADVNTADTGRSATVIVAGQSLTVFQRGVSKPACQMRTIEPNVAVTVPASTECSSVSFTFTASAGDQVAVIPIQSNSRVDLKLFDPAGAEVTSSSYGSRLPYIGYARLASPGVYRIDATQNYQSDASSIVLSLLPAGCNVTLTGGTSRISESGGKGTINVVSSGDCPWAVSSMPSWITIAQGATGKGSGIIEFNVAPNNSLFSRSATVLVSGQYFSVLQSGIGGSCAVMPIQSGVPVFSTLDESDCRTDYGAIYYGESWSFAGKAGETAILSFTSSGFGSGVSVELFGPDGKRISGSPVNQPFVLPSDGEYVIRISAYDSGGGGVNIDYRLSLYVSPANCGYRATASALSFNSTGGQGTVAVNAGGECPWIALSDSAWLTVTSGAAGKGDGTVAFTVAPNPNAANRRATVMVAGSLLSILQAGQNGNCVPQPLTAGQWVNGSIGNADCPSRYRTDSYYTVFADVYSFSGQGGEQIALLTNSDSVYSSLSLTLIDPAGRVVAGAQNDLPSRTGFVTLPATGTYTLDLSTTLVNPTTVNYSLLLMKTATGCGYALDSSSQRFGPAAGSGSFKLITQGECDWSASSSSNWITLNTATSGKGQTVVNFAVTANATADRRTGSINIANRTFTVEQAGKDGTCAIVPIAKNQTINGQWGQGDCAPRYFISGYNGYGDVYSFSGVAGDRVNVTMVADSTYVGQGLALIGPDGVVLRSQSGVRLPAVTGYFILPKSGNYLIEAVYTVATTYKLTVNAQAACAFEVTPANLLVPASGGAVSFGVKADATCDWLVRSNNDWINVATADSFGGGSRAAQAFVAPNTAFAERKGTLTIAGQIVTVTQAATSTQVSSASYIADELARGSLVTAYGVGLATSSELPNAPKNVVAGSTVRVRDGEGRVRDALITYASPSQINYVMPDDLAAGPAIVFISAADGRNTTADVKLVDVAPALFAANADGKGLATGVLLRVKADGSQSYESIVRYDESQKRFVAVLIDLAAEGDQVYFVGFGTGFRHRSSGAVTVKIGGVDVMAGFAGAQGSLVGLDQLNVQLPRILSGRGEVELLLTVDGKSANPVKLVIR